MLTFPLSDIAHVIQLAVAPVFLLTAVGTFLVVLTNRLGRAIDRLRALAAAIPSLREPMLDAAGREMEHQKRRIRLIYAAISLAVTCALLICLLIVLAFVDALLAMNLAEAVAALFILALLSLTASMTVLLREIFLAVNSAPTPIR